MADSKNLRITLIFLLVNNIVNFLFFFWSLCVYTIPHNKSGCKITTFFSIMQAKNTFFIKMQKIQQHFYGIVAEIYGFYTDLSISTPSRKSDHINGTERSEKTCRSAPGDASVKSLQNFLRNNVFPEIFSKVDPPL